MQQLVRVRDKALRRQRQRHRPADRVRDLFCRVQALFGRIPNRFAVFQNRRHRRVLLDAFSQAVRIDNRHLSIRRAGEKQHTEEKKFKHTAFPQKQQNSKVLLFYAVFIQPVSAFLVQNGALWSGRHFVFHKTAALFYRF